MASVNLGKVVTQITIGANGNFFLDGVDSGVLARGPQGEPGVDGAGLPPGGTTGQVLTKLSSANSDAGWANQTGGGGSGGGALPPGGAAGNFLVKASAADGDAVWYPLMVPTVPAEWSIFKPL